MKKLSDKEIQELLESNMQDPSAAASDDYKTYQLLFDTLAQAPEESLPLNFAEKVSQKAVQLSVKKQVRRYWLMLGLSILFTLSICAVSLFIYQLPAALMIYNWISEVRWIVLFSLVMLGLIQFADYWLMNKKRISPEV